MSSDAQDIAVARYLKQEGLVPPEHIQKALQLQANAVENGKPISLAQALLDVGAITPVIKETLEKRIKGEEKKGTPQVSYYRLKRKLGEGGMGAVYLTEDTRNGNKVALKVLPRKHAADDEFMKRFQREAEAACKLDHPNIIRAFEAGEDAGYHFYVMEYFEGEPLDTALKRQTLFSWHKSFEIVQEVSKGLAYAHGQGFIHRDIKPANIFITRQDHVKILDFGIARIASSDLTRSGAIIGTPSQEFELSPSSTGTMPSLCSSSRLPIFSASPSLTTRPLSPDAIGICSTGRSTPFCISSSKTRADASRSTSAMARFDASMTRAHSLWIV